jgi:hypothetical protein
MITVSAENKHQGLIEESMQINMDRALITCKTIHCRETLYTSSAHTAVIGKISMFPPVQVAVSAVSTHQGLIEESLLVDMDRVHIACRLVCYRETLYSSSTHTAAIGEIIAIFPPVLINGRCICRKQAPGTD